MISNPVGDNWDKGKKLDTKGGKGATRAKSRAQVKVKDTDKNTNDGGATKKQRVWLP